MLDISTITYIINYVSRELLKSNIKNMNYKISELGCSTLGEAIKQNRKTRRNWFIFWVVVVVAYIFALLAFIYIR